MSYQYNSPYVPTNLQPVQNQPASAGEPSYPSLNLNSQQYFHPPLPDTSIPMQSYVDTSTTRSTTDTTTPKKQPSKTKSCILNTIIVLLFLITATVLLLSFRWNPSQKETTETDESGDESTEIQDNSNATTFAIVAVVLVWLSIIGFNLYVLRSGGVEVNLSGFFFFHTVGPGVLFLFFGFLLWDDPHYDTIMGIRLAILLVVCIWMCFIASCVYVNTVTSRWFSSTTLYWSDGTQTTHTQSRAWGHVNCRIWGC